MERRIFLKPISSYYIYVEKGSYNPIEPQHTLCRAKIEFSVLIQGHLALIRHGHKWNLLVISLHLSDCGE